MASSNTIILSSSSPTSWIATTPPREFAAAMSSSPSLPSPSQLFVKRKPSMPSVSRGIAVPAVAVNGFTSASSLLAMAKEVEGSTVSAHFAVAPQAHDPSQEGLHPMMIHGNQPTQEAIVVKQVKKQKDPRKKSTAMKKHLSEITVRDSDEEGSHITEVVPVKNSRAPCKSSTGGAKQLPEMIVGVGDFRDVLMDGVVPTKKPKAPRKKPSAMDKQAGGANVLDHRSEPATIAGVTVVKKPRAKGTTEEGQTKIKKGKIVKPSVSSDQGSLKSGKANTKRKGLSEAALEFVAAEDVDQRRTHGHLGLDMATTRRKSWTPVKESYGKAGDKKPISHNASSPFKIDSPTTDDSRSTGNRILLGSYSYYKDSETAVARTAVPITVGEAPTKRRKVDFIDRPNYPLLTAKPIKKTKAPKPKPQTITGKATAPFMLEDPVTTSPLLQYLAPKAILGDPSSAQIDSLSENMAANSHGRRRPANPRKSEIVKSKATKVAPVLLPPEEAMKAMADEDVLFGTSSQLVREDSPTFIRDLQEAIKESESFNVLSDMIGADVSVAASSTGSNVLRRISTRNLWSEAARDSQGSLMEPEVIDLVNTPKACISTEQYSYTKPVTKPDPVLKPRAQDTGWVGIDPFAEPILQLDTETIPQKPAVSETNSEMANLVPSLPRSVAEAVLRSRPKSRSPSKKQKSPNPQADRKTDMPDFQNLTISELSKTISKYGFKPIKGKVAMVALLQKCWESKNRPALQSLPPNLNVSSLGTVHNDTIINTSKTPSPIKRKGRTSKAKNKPLSIAEDHPSVPTNPPENPRGRPRKEILSPADSNATRTEPIVKPSNTVLKHETILQASRKDVHAPHDDIEDPNPTPTPSPPRRRSPYLQLKLSRS